MSARLNKTHVLMAILITALATLVLRIFPPDLDTQTTILLIFAGLMGIPHGLTDWALLPKLAKSLGFSGGAFPSRAVGIGAYLLVMLTFMIIWKILPLLGLLIFLVCSVWHFGQQDALAHAIPQHQTRLQALFRGTFLIGMIYLAQPATANYFNLLIDEQVFVMPILRLVNLYVIAAVYILITLLSTKSLYVIESICLIPLCIVLPPLLSFTIYFCVWHAPRHYLFITKHISFYRMIDWRDTLIRYFVFEILLVACYLLIISFVKRQPQLGLSITLVVIFFKVLAALTMAHVFCSFQLGGEWQKSKVD